MLSLFDFPNHMSVYSYDSQVSEEAAHYVLKEKKRQNTEQNG